LGILYLNIALTCQKTGHLLVEELTIAVAATVGIEKLLNAQYRVPPGRPADLLNYRCRWPKDNFRNRRTISKMKAGVTRRMNPTRKVGLEDNGEPRSNNLRS
jgi:hypothetical protein